MGMLNHTPPDHRSLRASATEGEDSKSWDREETVRDYEPPSMVSPEQQADHEERRLLADSILSGFDDPEDFSRRSHDYGEEGRGSD